MKAKIFPIITVCLLIILTSIVAYTSASEPQNLTATASLPQPPTQSGFPIALNDKRINSSSIALADIDNDGIDEIIVGDMGGRVQVYRGDGTKLWDYDTGDMSIEGKAGIGDIDGDGHMEIVVGAGSTFTPNAHGGLYVLSHDGQLQCEYQTGDFIPDGWRDGVISSPALADFNDNGKMEIVFGGWDAYVRMIDHDCDLVWEKFVRDSVWSSAAIADIDRDGYLDIVIGVDSHDEPDLVPRIYKGGRLEVLNRFGYPLPGFPIHIDEVIYSSPAIGDINNDGWSEIIVGTGYFWDNPVCNHPDGCTPWLTPRMYAYDHTGTPLPGWPIILGDPNDATEHYVWASPALADIDEDGSLEIIVNSADAKVHAWNADTSEVSGWPQIVKTPSGCSTSVSFPTRSSPTVADLDGDGHLEVLLASNWEIVIWNKDGVQLTKATACQSNSPQLSADYTVNSSPAVGDVDGDNDLEVLIGSAIDNGGTQGGIYAWDFAGAATDENLPWPVFRRNETNLGRYPTPPTLSVSPSPIVILHEFGNASPRQFMIGIQNLGEGSFSWSGITSDGDLSITPDNGTVGATRVFSQATLVTNGLAKGIYPYDITFTGLDDGNPVIGSPSTVPVTLHVVDTVYSIYLPEVAR